MFLATIRRAGWVLSLSWLAVGLTVTPCSAEPPAKTKAKADDTKHFYRSYVGKRPPELTGELAHWVNQKAPVTLEKLHGQVVWLEFNF